MRSNFSVKYKLLLLNIEAYHLQISRFCASVVSSPTIPTDASPFDILPVSKTEVYYNILVKHHSMREYTI